MPAKRTFAGLAVVAVLTAAAATACGDDDDTGDPDAASRLDTVTGALATLPATGVEPIGILWGDLARAAEIAGLDRPTDPTDSDAVREYLQGLTGVRPDAVVRDGGGTTVALVPPQVAQIEPSTDLGPFVDDVGWSILQVDRFVEVDPVGQGVTVLEGAFDDDALTAALGKAANGTWVAGSAEPGGVAPDDRSPARPIGESLWLAGGGALLSISRSPDAIEGANARMSGRRDGGGPGADPVLAGLATALDEHSAYAALLVRPGISDPAAGILEADPTGDPADDVAAFCDQLLPEATTGVATGIADDGRPVVLVALAHASPAAAAANAGAIEEMIADGTSQYAERPWRELVELDGVTTSADDLITVARLRPSDAAGTHLWHDLVQTRDNLVNSC